MSYSMVLTTSRTMLCVRNNEYISPLRLNLVTSALRCNGNVNLVTVVISYIIKPSMISIAAVIMVSSRLLIYRCVLLVSLC